MLLEYIQGVLVVGWIKPCGIKILYYSTGRIHLHYIPIDSN